MQFKSHEIKRLIRVAPLSHDYTWTPSGAIWRTMGNQILRWHPRRDAGWVEIHRFELPDLQELTRIVVHPDMKWVAVVAAEKADE